MKSVLILTGNIRTFEQSKNIFKEIIDTYNCDVFICTSSLQYELHPFIKTSHNFYLEKELTVDEIYDKLDVLNPQEIIILSEDQIKLQYTTSTSDYDEYLTCLKYQYFRKKILFDIIQSQDIMYDYIISTRFDIVIENIDSFPENVLKNDIFVASFHQDHVQDHIFISGSIDALVRLNNFILKELKENPYDNIHKMLFDGVEYEKLNLNSISSLNYHINRNFP
jgi:hypothetical protein